AARAQVVVCEQIVCEQHAGALTRGIERVIGAVEAQPAGYVDALDARRSEPVGPRRHRGTAGESIIMNEGRAGRGLPGPEGSVAFDYSGTAYRYERQLDELLNHQRRVGAWIDRQITHRDVDAIGCEISVSIEEEMRTSMSGWQLANRYSLGASHFEVRPGGVL